MPKPPRLVVQAVFWIALAATAFLSLVPSDMLPRAFNWWDKAQHALGFAVLTALGLLAFPTARWHLPWALLLFGALIELAQAASGWRQGDWWDWLADAVGILAVLVVWQLVRPPDHNTASPRRD